MATDVPRCDAHGPYTGEEAALMLLGAWEPIPTHYACAECQRAVSFRAHEMAEIIDAQVLSVFLRGYGYLPPQ